MQPGLIFNKSIARSQFKRLYSPANLLVKEVASSIKDRIQMLKGAPNDVLAYNAIGQFEGSKELTVWDSDDEDSLATASHDTVISLFSLHIANDPIKAMHNYMRCLKPNGLFLATVFGGQTLKELRQAMIKADLKLIGGTSPRVYPMIDVKDIGMLAQKAGFKNPVSDSEVFDFEFNDARELLNFTRSTGYSNCLYTRSKAPIPKNYLNELNSIFGGSKIKATFEVNTLTAFG